MTGSGQIESNFKASLDGQRTDCNRPEADFRAALKQSLTSELTGPQHLRRSRLLQLRVRVDPHVGRQVEMRIHLRSTLASSITISFITVTSRGVLTS